MKKYIVALDQGTTSSRAVVVDASGAVVAAHGIEFPQIYPKPGWVEHDPQQILSSQVEALRQAVKKAGIAPEDAYAIGDGYNDITMMKVVGHSIAMGNAVDELKEVADYVTADILDDGLYKAFEHYDLL